eukprot:823785-Prorocentrum_minimum.AAC.1
MAPSANFNFITANKRERKVQLLRGYVHDEFNIVGCSDQEWIQRLNNASEKTLNGCPSRRWVSGK